MRHFLNNLENNTVEGFELSDGLVFKLKLNKRLLCVPKEMEQNIICIVNEKLIQFMSIILAFDQI